MADGFDFHDTTRSEPVDLDSFLFDEPPTISELAATLKAGAHAIRVIGLVSGAARRREAAAGEVRAS